MPRWLVRTGKIVAPLGLIAFLSWGVWACLDNAAIWVGEVNPFNPLAGLEQDYIDANIPAPEHFDRLLTRDLEAYFTERKQRTVTVGYELLADGPSQAGIAYPKYYAWVRVSDSTGTVEEGVVRVAAIDTTGFEVAQYFSTADIKRDPSTIHEYFGDDVVTKIQALLK